MTVLAILLPMLAAPSLASHRPAPAGERQEPTLTVGIFIGAIEEGARIFTPVRLLPFEHPEADGHEFPNALALHESELELLVDLGRRVGLSLGTTLERYPRPPVEEWAYDGFEPPPGIGPSARTVEATDPPPLPGLGAAYVRDGRPIAFIVDTRGMTLAERGMTRPTSMGLDLTRASFLELLGEAIDRYAPSGEVVVTFSR